MRKLIAHIHRPSAGTVIGVIALVFAIGGGGYAALGAEDKKTAVKLYRPDRFLPEHSGIGYESIGLGSRACTSSPFQEGGGFFRADVDPPDGAKITKVTFYYADNDADDDLTFGLAGFFIAQRVPGAPEGGLHLNDEIVPEASSSGASTDNKSVEVTPPTPYEVDNANEDLALSVGFEECTENGSLVLHGARIEYRFK